MGFAQLFNRKKDEKVDEQTPLVANVDDEVVGGGKDISFFGGLTLLTNSITGPGIVTLPVLMQRAGWLT
jgi:hypothetical protein